MRHDIEQRVNRRWLVPVLLALPLLVAGGVAAAEQDDPRSVTVGGSATVHAAPDRADVRLAVVTQRDSAEAARADNEAAAAETLSRIREQAIDDSDVRTADLRLQPRHEYDPETREHREIGFEAVREIHVHVRDPERLPALIAEVVAGGANRLHSVQYDLDDRTEARNEALREAALAARDKAHVLASTLEAELGRVVAIREQRYDFGRPRMAQLETVSDRAGDPEAWAPGEIEVTAEIEVRFALRGGDAPWPF